MMSAEREGTVEKYSLVRDEEFIEKILERVMYGQLKESFLHKFEL